MSGRMTVAEYLRRKPETMRPMELVYGVVREPPAPFFPHQAIVTHLGGLLDQHVRRGNLGVVSVAPVDVVLDAGRHLVVQPDIVFVAAARRAIIRDRIWGAPELVVEVLSRRTAARDRTRKLGWYREYGVAEYWVVDPVRKAITVVPLTPRGRRRRFSSSALVVSTVLPTLSLPVSAVFA
jgi:Uma2 family endonuclease